MTAPRGVQPPGHRTGLLAAAALFLGSAFVAQAANLDPDCPSLKPDADAAALPAPVLRIEVADVVTPPPAPLTTHDLAPREIPSMTSRQTADELLDDTGKAAEDAELQDGDRSTLPPTATRLPGVDDEDLPRFRRQMFRTDI